MDNVVHFEIPVDDVERAEKFYTETFGWGISVVKGIDYYMVATGELDSDNMPKKAGFINGGMMKRSDKIQHPVITIGVEDIDKSIKDAKKNGAKLIVDKIKVEEMGYSAYIKDTEGNIIGLWQTLLKM